MTWLGRKNFGWDLTWLENFCSDLKNPWLVQLWIKPAKLAKNRQKTGKNRPVELGKKTGVNRPVEKFNRTGPVTGQPAGPVPVCRSGSNSDIQGVPKVIYQKFFRISLLFHLTLSTIFFKIIGEYTKFLFIRTTFHTTLQNYHLWSKYKNFAFFVRCE